MFGLIAFPNPCSYIWASILRGRKEGIQPVIEQRSPSIYDKFCWRFCAVPGQSICGPLHSSRGNGNHSAEERCSTQLGVTYSSRIICLPCVPLLYHSIRNDNWYHFHLFLRRLRTKWWNFKALLYVPWSHGICAEFQKSTRNRE